MPASRISATLFAVLVLSSPAYAGTVCTDLVPPARYLEMPAPDYDLVPINNLYTLHRKCGHESRLGCAWSEPNVVYYLAGLERDAVRFRCFKRHEEAHLNGWPADHPEF